MSEATFQPGDVVQLKSGGPAMVVERAYEDGRVVCVWHAGGSVQTSTCQPWVLETVPATALTQAERYLQEMGQSIKRTMDAFTARTGEAKG